MTGDAAWKGNKELMKVLEYVWRKKEERIFVYFFKFCGISSFDGYLIRNPFL